MLGRPTMVMRCVLIFLHLDRPMVVDQRTTSGVYRHGNTAQIRTSRSSLSPSTIHAQTRPGGTGIQYGPPPWPCPFTCARIRTRGRPSDRGSGVHEIMAGSDPMDTKRRSESRKGICMVGWAWGERCDGDGDTDGDGDAHGWRVCMGEGRGLGVG